MQEISKFDQKINVIPNVLEKYMAFTVNRNLVFIDSMQFMNPSLDALVKNLSDNGFRYLLQEFSGAIASSYRQGKLLELAKQRGVYPYEYMNSFRRFFDNRLPDRSGNRSA